MCRRMAALLLLATLGCPGNPADPGETGEGPGLAVVTITGSLTRSDTLRAILPPQPGVILPGADTLFFLDVLMMPELFAQSQLLIVSIRVQAPGRYATGVFAIEPDRGTFVMDTIPTLSLDPDTPDLTFSATGGELEITANADALLIGRFDFTAADGTGRTIRAAGTFDARPPTFGPAPPGPRGQP